MQFYPLRVYLKQYFPPFFFSVHSPLTFSFIFVQCLFSKNLRSKSKKYITEATATADGEFRSTPWWHIYEWAFTPFFCQLSANLQFHCCLVLICFILIIFVLQYFRRVYLQKFTQHHNKTAETTKKRVGTAFVILFT